MVDSQILKSKLHILLNFEYFLLPRASIYLVQLICLVSLKHVVSFLLVFLPSLLFLLPFLVQTLSVTLWIALSITVKTWVRCYPFSESGELRQRSVKCLFKRHSFLDKKKSCAFASLTPVSLAQTFTLACPAAQWYHWEVISACP